MRRNAIFVIMKPKTAKTILLIIGAAIILTGLALFFFEQYWLKLPFIALLFLMGLVIIVAFRRKPDFWPLVCGMACALQTLWYCFDFYRGNSDAIYCFPPPMPNWYLIIQFLLCLSGIYLTIDRFIRKKKGREYKELAWISLAVSIVFFIGVRAYYLL